MVAFPPWYDCKSDGNEAPHLARSLPCRKPCHMGRSGTDFAKTVPGLVAYRARWPWPSSAVHAMEILDQVPRIKKILRCLNLRKNGVEFHEGDRASGHPRSITDRDMLGTQRRKVNAAATATFKGLCEFSGRVVDPLERIVRGRHNVAVQGCDLVRVTDGMQDSPSRHHTEVRQQPGKLRFPFPALLRRFHCGNTLGDALPYLCRQLLRDCPIRVPERVLLVEDTCPQRIDPKGAERFGW